MRTDVSELSFEQQLYEARKRTELLINVRDRSVKELKDRLLKAGFSAGIVEQEVKRAVQAGLVDDERFTKLYLLGKKRSGWGRNRIENEIRRYGIDLRLCDGYPESFFDDDEELLRAQVCLESFHTRAKDVWAASYRRLISRGFSAQTAHRVLLESKEED